MNGVKAIGKNEFQSEVLDAQGLVVVDFSATWCGPCKRMLPELEAAATELKDRAKIVKVDVDEAPEIANQYGVQGIPNLTFFSGGKPVDVAVGAMPKAQILARINRNLEAKKVG
jgi:thioredoxin 1